jgi:DNA-binding response OmpR family regulator
MIAPVLVVDDSLTIRMDLAETLAAADFDTVLCATIAEARAAVAVGHFALIILDVLLPDGDGVDFLRELRERPESASTPVMLLSSEAEVRDRIRGLRTGADEYVGKPYEARFIVARARELLRRADPAPQPSAATILVIDDSATFRLRLKGALEEAGFVVLLAESGEEGLRVAADLRPTAIVVDGVLPGIDGATVIRRLRLDAALRRTPCLLLTGTEGGAAEVRALDSGADAFVRKEQDTGIMLARLRALLRAAPAEDIGKPASILAPRKILAVDDSETYLQAMAARLGQEGFEVVLARSGEEAIDLLAVQPVDCILLDLAMPGIGGQETCRRIKATQSLRDIPIVMVTALDDREAMIAGLVGGADDFIAKSADFAVLRARLAAQIRRKQFEDENRLYRERLLQKELETSEARAAQKLAETRAALSGALEAKNRELETFSYSVSHDLRAPLRSIASFSRLIAEDHAETLDATGREYLGRVEAAARRMGELIEDLMVLARVGRAELKREPVDLSATGRAVAAELARGEPDHGARIVIADGLVAEGDARLLRIVLENLFGNAWKFSRLAAAPAIEFGGMTGSRPGFYVRDNGAGFDMAFADKLFAPFERLHSTAQYPGTGVGLATVQRIVTRHGGRIWAESRIGHGATFFWTLGEDAPDDAN